MGHFLQLCQLPNGMVVIASSLSMLILWPLDCILLQSKSTLQFCIFLNRSCIFRFKPNPHQEREGTRTFAFTSSGKQLQEYFFTYPHTIFKKGEKKQTIESLFSWPFAAKLQSSAKQIKISGGKINPFPAQQGKLNLELISLSIHICIYIYTYIYTLCVRHIPISMYFSIYRKHSESTSFPTKILLEQRRISCIKHW